VKRKCGTVDEKNMTQQIFVLPISESPVQSLLVSLSQVYGPRLRKSNVLDKKTTSALNILEKGLEQAAGRNLSINKKKTSEVDISAILSIADEVNYWKSLASDSDRAEVFLGHLTRLQAAFQNILSKTPDAVLILIDEVSNLVADLWNNSEFDGPGYLQVRMENLLKLCATEFVKYVIDKGGKVDTWRGPIAEVRQCLESGLQICLGWIATTKFLTDTEFGDRFKGEIMVHQDVALLQARLTEIKKCRSTVDELLRV
jgi:hypothetical protein